jgi:hypothetical protein
MSYFFMHYKESNGRETYRHFETMQDLTIFREKYLPNTKVSVTLRWGYGKTEFSPVITAESGEKIPV